MWRRGWPETRNDLAGARCAGLARGPAAAAGACRRSGLPVRANDRLGPRGLWHLRRRGPLPTAQPRRLAAAQPSWWVVRHDKWRGIVAASGLGARIGAMEETAAKPFVPVHFAVLTVSDTRSLDEDRSGGTLADRIAGAGHVLADRAHRHRRRQEDPLDRQEMAEESRDRRDHHHRRHRLHRPRRDPRRARAAVRQAHGRASAPSSTASATTRSAPRRSSRAPPPASPARLSSSACPARPGPARTPGTASS